VEKPPLNQKTNAELIVLGLRPNLMQPLDPSSTPIVVSGHTSRCFRTGPDGSIALTTAWPSLLRAIFSVGDIALQTRHPAARLVGLAAVTTTKSSHRGCQVSQGTGEFSFHFDHWHSAAGFLRGSALHVVGRDDAVLLTLSAATDGLAATTWEEALQAAFPAF
jgi:hypothetical protein